jgi:tripartite-type tricarboxylate transporter receptor subunit TctC
MAKGKAFRLMVLLVAGFVLVASLATACSRGQQSEAAQQKPSGPSWPGKDIVLVVPYKPGGGYDTQARVFAPLWEKHLPRKASVVVNNQPGAGGKIGSLAVMKATPDGHTVGLLSPTSLALMQVGGELENFDIRKLTWLGQLSWDAGVLVSSASSGLKKPEDLNKREVRFGVTDDSVFPCSLLAKKLGIKARMVMFDGTSEQVLACMRGDVDLMMDSWTSMKKAVDNSQGKLVPMFAIANNRLPKWPDVPSSQELGLDLSDLYAIAGSARLLGGPPGIPSDIRDLMDKSVWDTLQDPEFATNMEKAGYLAFPAKGSEAEQTVKVIMSVLEENRDVLQSLGK